MGLRSDHSLEKCELCNSLNLQSMSLAVTCSTAMPSLLLGGFSKAHISHHCEYQDERVFFLQVNALHSRFIFNIYCTFIRKVDIWLFYKDASLLSFDSSRFDLFQIQCENIYSTEL